MKKPSTPDIDIQVSKRNGQVVAFNPVRIHNAIANAFKEVNELPREADLSEDLYADVEKVTLCVLNTVKGQAGSGEPLTVESIQDEVIRQLFENGYNNVAESYRNYRMEQAAKRSVFDLYKLQKRDSKVVSFKPEKITVAIAKAFRAVTDGDLTDEILDEAREISDLVVAQIHQKWPEGKTLNIEEVQDFVEKGLMNSNRYDVAKRYIVYREERRKARDLKSIEIEASFDWARKFEVQMRDGSTAQIDLEDLLFKIQSCCKGLEDVSAEAILKESLKNYFNGITEKQIEFSNTLAARSFIEKEPNYSLVAARLLLLTNYKESIGSHTSFESIKAEYPRYLSQYINKAVELELLSSDLLQFDLNDLGMYIKPERDLDLRYMGMQTLYDRYFIHWQDRRLEMPQIFWMRVAMGLAKEEKDKNAWAKKFYDVLSSLNFVSSTPTLFNSGTIHSQLSSCYLSTIEDDLHHIFKVMQDDAMLSKWSGGLGNDWTNVRAMGSRIKGTNGKSQGVIPFLKVANDVAVAVNQGGKRQGAMCAYLETWHLDIEEFLELRKNTGDDRRRTHDMHTANWIPDLFMKRVKADAEWTLLTPSEAPDLHHLYGKAFEKRYAEYEAMAEAGKIKKFKKVSATQLWRKMLTMLFETGHPWITWKDPSNLRSPQDHTGVVHCSNLCTEILLNTSAEETAVCNLGSVNLAQHVNANGLDLEKLEKTIKVAMRMLDNVVDINYYPTAEAKKSNLKHRPVGLGLMGFQDALYIQGMSYASAGAVEFADTSMEAISYYAILASTELAAERGKYESYKGSKWDRGILPIDSLKLLSEERGLELKVDMGSTLDWDVVRQAVKKNGMRNSNTMAIAPTATIGNISGVTASIEPTFKNIFVKSNLSGEFTVPNVYLVEDLKARGLWDQEMINDLKYFDGSVQEVNRIPQDVKSKYPSAFEIDYEWVVEAAARRQKWIDMGQSLNLYQASTNGKKLSDMYMYAWEAGLKTTYYLRSMGATRIEKSTLDVNKYGDVLGQKGKDDQEEKLSAEQCSILNGPDCEACQ